MPAAKRSGHPAVLGTLTFVSMLSVLSLALAQNIVSDVNFVHPLQFK
ncbi:MAG TPA: hypothetical protein VI320_01130 [Terracidiphilus sp.]|jgi:hypothetical protein